MRYIKIFSILIIINFNLMAQNKTVAWTSLTSEQQTLVNAAISSMEKAYAPYSQYKVGAAIQGENNKIYSGFNIENASYGLTICAERTALFNGITAEQTHFKAIAIATRNGGMPCGACRQTLNEFSPDLLVIVTDKNKNNIEITTLSKLLPRSFGPKQLS